MKVFGILGLVFTLVGVGLLIPAAILASNALAFRAGATRASGTVIGRDGSAEGGPATAQPIVRYALPNGEVVEIVGDISSRPPAYDVGERVDVLYDPATPKAARIDTFLEMWFLPVLLGGMGTTFVGIGVPFLLWIVYRKRQVAWLKSRGRRMQVRVQQVAVDSTVSMNRRHPYRIVGEWHDPTSNTVHIFKSDMLWFDPSRYLTGETIDVLYDPQNLKRYWVDTSFLPNVSE